MFEVTKKDNNHLDIKMSGSLNAEEMKTALDELINQSKDIKNGTMLYDVVDFHLPSLGAIAIELAHFPTMLGFMKKFHKAAVLTDKKWLKKISEFEGVFYPHMKIKAFTRDQKQQAEAWLSH